LPDHGDDSNKRLVVAALQSARHSCPNPLFILDLGDNLAHASKRMQPFVANNVEKELASQVAAVFPGKPVFAVPGNNDYGDDDDQQDYSVQSPSFLRAFASSWSQRIDNLNEAGFGQTFSSNGCFAVQLPGVHHCKLIGLDTSYFINYNAPQQSLNQINWMSNEVSQARNSGDTVWLAFHIAPNAKGEHQWNHRVKAAFWKSFLDGSNAPAVIFCGHTHRDELQVIVSGDRPITVLHTVPAVSPIYANNPGYQVFEVNTNTGELLNCRTYWLDLRRAGNREAWPLEYRSDDSPPNGLGISKYDPSDVLSFVRRLRSDGKLEKSYWRFYSVEDPTAHAPFGEPKWLYKHAMIIPIGE
jgi:predicted phosphodiesterase